MTLAKASHCRGSRSAWSRDSKALWIGPRSHLVLSVERLRLYRWHGIALPVSLTWLRLGRWRYLDVTLGG